jgi:hypothetical protein
MAWKETEQLLLRHTSTHHELRFHENARLERRALWAIRWQKHIPGHCQQLRVDASARDAHQLESSVDGLVVQHGRLVHGGRHERVLSVMEDEQALQLRGATRHFFKQMCCGRSRLVGRALWTTTRTRIAEVSDHNVTGMYPLAASQPASHISKLLCSA